MAIIIDIIIVALIALSIWMGYKKGLIGVGFKIITFILAILITMVLYYPISNFVITHTKIDDSIAQTIEKNFISDETEESTKPEDSNLSVVIVNYINDVANQAKETSVTLVANQLAQTIVRAGVAICLFLILRIILALFKIFSDILSSLPIIKQCNKAGGIAYGLVKGLFIVYLVLAVFSLIAPTVANLGILELIQKSYLGNMMYNHNFILLLLFH